MKNATMEELRYNSKITINRLFSLISYLMDAMHAYVDKEPDQNKVYLIYQFGGTVIDEAYEWMDDLPIESQRNPDHR